MKDYTKLAVFDFDDTLFETPGELEVKRKYFEIHDKGLGVDVYWADHEFSLDTKEFDINKKYLTHQELEKAKQETNTYVVLLTGRSTLIKKGVKNVLEFNNIDYFNEIILRQPNVHVLEHKLSALDKIVQKLPNVMECEFWDDRYDFAPHFKSWGIRNFGYNWTQHLVN